MTLKDLLAEAVAAQGEGVALRYKEQGGWQPVTYRQFLDRVRCASELLAREGIRPGDRVALLHENAPAWPVMYFAIVGMGATAVPLDPKLKEQELAYMLRDASVRALFSGVRSYALLRGLEGRLPDLQTVILVDGRDVIPVDSDQVDYLDYEQAAREVADAAGRETRAYDRHEPKPEALASLIYTSGTTGRQKAAMLSHRNFTANVESCRQVAPMGPEDNFLLVLPLHHAFAFTANLLLPVACHAEISFVENLKTVGENLRELSPTVLIGVPLLLEKMHARIRAALKKNRVGSALFRLGLKKPVTRRILQSLGGRLRLVITGGAPCPAEVLAGFAELGIPIAEGYGLTETGPVLSMNPLSRPRPGTVGKPLPGVDLKILDPDPDGIGEIAARGPNVMSGYYNAPEETAQVLKDGWFQTGDLGRFDADGYLTITGRKKSVIINREGKNIFPEEVEAAIGKSPYISEVLALGYGDARATGGEKVGIIVVPNEEAMDAYAAQHRRTMSAEDIRALLRDEVTRTSQALAEYKRPRRIRVRTEEFLKTTTGKIKRYLYSLEELEVE